jgi:uncharacterized protein (TIGR00369 family)
MPGANASARTRTVEWDDPLPGFELGRTMSGLDYLRAMAAGKLPQPPVAKLLGFGIGSIERGRVTFEADAAEYHYNPIGTVHGGVICTLLDSAMGCAVHSLLEPGHAYTTLELKVNFLRAVTVKTGHLRCTGTIVHSGSRVALADAKLTDDAGTLYAHGTSTCMIFAPKAG